MFDRIRKLFQRREVPMASKIDFGLESPGAKFVPTPPTSVAATEVKPVIVPQQPETDSVPRSPQPVAPVVAQPIAPKTITDVCSHCGQSMPVKAAAVVDYSVLTAEWNDCNRQDLPPRTPFQIQSLIIAGES
jgi:hypothetical protein